MASLVRALRVPGPVLSVLASWAIPADTRAWTTGGRVQVTVPGLRNSAAGTLREEITERVGELPGVAWVAVNGVLERVVVGLDTPPASLEEIERRIGKALDE